MTPFKFLLGIVECLLIFPAHLSDPLQLRFIVAVIGIRNDFVAHQVLVNGSGNLRRHPLFRTGTTEFPIAVKVENIDILCEKMCGIKN